LNQIKTYLKLLRNKYIITGVAFSFLLLLNDRYGLIDQYNYAQELKEVKEKHQYYSKEIVRVKTEQEELFGSAKNLEKFAREKYLMKADDEDVFVMIKED
jgi:hypothetical protein